MGVYGMLCLNALREYRRLIRHMLIPLSCLAITVGVAGYELAEALLPALWNGAGFNGRAQGGIVLTLMVYAGYGCFVRNRPVITVKPASIFLFREDQLRRLMRIRFLEMALRHGVLAFFLTACVNGIHFNGAFATVMVSFFFLMHAGCLLRWKLYHEDKRRWQDAGLLLLLGLLAPGARVYPPALVAIVGIWAGLALYDRLSLELNMIKYEDEMRFLEKIRTAQNYHNMVFLNQYAREKKVRYLPQGKRMPILLEGVPLLWKAALSLSRLSKDLILAGVLLFAVSLAVCKLPFFWSLPFLDQKEIRRFLLTGSVFAIYQLTIQSMLRQLDSMLEKARDGLFLPLAEKQIIKQFAAVPVLAIGVESVTLAVVTQRRLLGIFVGSIALMAVTAIVFWLDVKHREWLVKGYFILSVVVFCLYV